MHKRERIFRSSLLWTGSGVYQRAGLGKGRCDIGNDRDSIRHQMQRRGIQQTALARSLGRLTHDRRLAFHVTLSNSTGLPEIYNRRIRESAHDILVFVHDDVWIDDYFLATRVIDGLGLYHVIGVAGNTRLVDSHVAWHLRKGEWDFPHLSGSVAHGAAPFGRISHYGDSPRECELLDGVLLAARRSVLQEKGCPSTRDFLSISTISISVAQRGKAGYRWEHGRSRLPTRAEAPSARLSGRRRLRSTKPSGPSPKQRYRRRNFKVAK